MKTVQDYAVESKTNADYKISACLGDEFVNTMTHEDQEFKYLTVECAPADSRERSTLNQLALGAVRKTLNSGTHKLIVDFLEELYDAEGEAGVVGQEIELELSQVSCAAHYWVQNKGTADKPKWERVRNSKTNEEIILSGFPVVRVVGEKRSLDSYIGQRLRQIAEQSAMNGGFVKSVVSKDTPDAPDAEDFGM